jgi:hypothetical protein
MSQSICDTHSLSQPTRHCGAGTPRLACGFPGSGLSPASEMGPLRGEVRQQDGTTLPPVMGPTLGVVSPRCGAFQEFVEGGPTPHEVANQLGRLAVEDSGGTVAEGGAAQQSGRGAYSRSATRRPRHRRGERRSRCTGRVATGSRRGWSSRNALEEWGIAVHALGTIGSVEGLPAWHREAGAGPGVGAALWVGRAGRRGGILLVEGLVGTYRRAAARYDLVEGFDSCGDQGSSCTGSTCSRSRRGPALEEGRWVC